MDKPVYLGFAVLDLSKLIMYETYYERHQPYFGSESIQNHYSDCDSMILSIRLIILLEIWTISKIYLILAT